MMKKALFGVGIIVFAFVLISVANNPPVNLSLLKKQSPKACVGYTVIEAGKGIDCNGDTIRLVKKHGYFEVSRQ